MLGRFKKSRFAAALVVAGIGMAHAEGLYLGGNLGSPDYKRSINGVGGNGSGVGGKLFGGYQITPNFALEAGVFDLGHIEDAAGKVKLSGGFVDAVGSYGFAPRWSLLGRAGLAEGRFSGSTGKDSSPAFKLGAGLQYDLSKQVALRAEYEHYRFSDAFDAKPKVGEFSLGVKVGF
jgi:OOP family OmpA-OmpF porin